MIPPKVYCPEGCNGEGDGEAKEGDGEARGGGGDLSSRKSHRPASLARLGVHLS